MLDSRIAFHSILTGKFMRNTCLFMQLSHQPIIWLLQVIFTLNIRMRKTGDLSDFDPDMSVSARSAGLSNPETAGLVGLSCTKMLRKPKKISKSQFFVGNAFVDVRGDWFELTERLQTFMAFHRHPYP